MRFIIFRINETILTVYLENPTVYRREREAMYLGVSCMPYNLKQRQGFNGFEEGYAMMEFNIANVIDEQLIALDLDVHTKEEMLNRLTDLFEEQGKLNDRDAFFKDVLWREGEGQTGIGMGVAIPHGKSAGVNQTALAVGTSKNMLAWESLDDEPVNVVILFAVTEGDSDIIHLKLMQRVAMLLAHESFIEKLHAVQTPHEMLALLESNPDDYDD